MGIYRAEHDHSTKHPFVMAQPVDSTRCTMLSDLNQPQRVYGKVHVKH